MGTLGQIRVAGGQTDVLLGTEPRDLAGVDIGEFLSVADRRRLFDEMRGAGGSATRPLKFELIGKSGAVPVELTVEPSPVGPKGGQGWVVRCEPLGARDEIPSGTARGTVPVFSVVEAEAMGVSPPGQSGSAAPGARLDLSARAIERALRTAAFDLDLQPIVDLSTGEAVGYEALVRWVQPGRGRVPAATFLAAVEDAGLMANLSRRVLERGLERLMDWAGDLPLRGITVNVAASDLALRGFALDVGRIVSDAGVDPQRLALEFTEAALRLDPDGLRGTLANLRDVTGVQLALDNFGTVRSTRAGLLLPVDIIKLDSSVTQTPESSRHQAVLASLRELSSADGPLVIGEGIEDPSQLAVLEGVGWRYAQGYLLGRPRPAHDER